MTESIFRTNCNKTNELYETLVTAGVKSEAVAKIKESRDTLCRIANISDNSGMITLWTGALTAKMFGESLLNMASNIGKRIAHGAEKGFNSVDNSLGGVALGILGGGIGFLYGVGETVIVGGYQLVTGLDDVVKTAYSAWENAENLTPREMGERLAPAFGTMVALGGMAYGGAAIFSQIKNARIPHGPANLGNGLVLIQGNDLLQFAKGSPIASAPAVAGIALDPDLNNISPLLSSAVSDAPPAAKIAEAGGNIESPVVDAKLINALKEEYVFHDIPVRALLERAEAALNRKKVGPNPPSKIEYLELADSDSGVTAFAYFRSGNGRYAKVKLETELSKAFINGEQTQYISFNRLEGRPIEVDFLPGRNITGHRLPFSGGPNR